MQLSRHLQIFLLGCKSQAEGYAAFCFFVLPNSKDFGFLARLMLMLFEPVTIAKSFAAEVSSGANDFSFAGFGDLVRGRRFALASSLSWPKSASTGNMCERPNLIDGSRPMRAFSSIVFCVQPSISATCSQLKTY